MNLQAEFSRRQIISLLEKAVVDKKLPDTLLFQFESTISWPFTEAQEKILLSYATKENLNKSAWTSAEIVKRIGKMSGEIKDERFCYPNTPPPESVKVQPVIIRQEPEVRYVTVSQEPRYSRGEWERIQANERAKEVAKAQVTASLHPKDPTLNKFYRKVEIEN